MKTLRNTMLSKPANLLGWTIVLGDNNFSNYQPEHRSIMALSEEDFI